MHFFLGALRVKVAEIYKVSIQEIKCIEFFAYWEIRMPSADILLKSTFLENSFSYTSSVEEFGSRSSPTFRLAKSGSNMFE